MFSFCKKQGPVGFVPQGLRDKAPCFTLLATENSIPFRVNKVDLFYLNVVVSFLPKHVGQAMIRVCKAWKTFILQWSFVFSSFSHQPSGVFTKKRTHYPRNPSAFLSSLRSVCMDDVSNTRHKHSIESLLTLPFDSKQSSQQSFSIRPGSTTIDILGYPMFLFQMEQATEKKEISFFEFDRKMVSPIATRCSMKPMSPFATGLLYHEGVRYKLLVHNYRDEKRKLISFGDDVQPSSLFRIDFDTNPFLEQGAIGCFDRKYRCESMCLFDFEKAQKLSQLVGNKRDNLIHPQWLHTINPHLLFCTGEISGSCLLFDVRTSQEVVGMSRVVRNRMKKDGVRSCPQSDATLQILSEYQFLLPRCHTCPMDDFNNNNHQVTPANQIVYSIVDTRKPSMTMHVTQSIQSALTTRWRDFKTIRSTKNRHMGLSSVHVVDPYILFHVQLTTCSLLPQLYGSTSCDHTLRHYGLLAYRSNPSKIIHELYVGETQTSKDIQWMTFPYDDSSSLYILRKDRPKEKKYTLYKGLY